MNNTNSNLNDLFNNGETRVFSTMYDIGTPILNEVLESLNTRRNSTQRNSTQRNSTTQRTNSTIPRRFVNSTTPRSRPANTTDAHNDNDNNNGSNTAQYNVFTSETEIKIIVYLPGVIKENISVNINNNKLIITAKTNIRDEDWEHLKETAYECNIKLEEKLQKENLKVQFNNGIMKIKINKDIDDENIPIEIN